MGIGKGGAVARQLRALIHVGSTRDLTDGQLLERFATGGDEAAGPAFGALVDRHGPMVLRACRGILDDPHDAEDAFQATFLVLVARGRSLWVRDSLGPWLHQVARRTALHARADASRRRRLERGAAVDVRAPGRPEGVDDLGRALHEEIGRLPERDRAVVVLCDLEGRTHEQAARSLGWPVGTVKSRQARARARLRDRLTRRGLAPEAGLALIPPGLVGAPPPPSSSLIDATTAAAVRFVEARAIVPGTAAALAHEVIRAMTILQWSKAASLLLALGAAAAGAGRLAQDPPGLAPKAAEGQPPRAGKADDDPIIPITPGTLRRVANERGNLEPSRPRDLVNQVAVNTTIVRVQPDGDLVKQGEVLVELDSAAIRNDLIAQRIVAQQAEAAYKQAKLVREVAEYAVREYTEMVLPQEREALKAKIEEAQQAAEKGKARLDRTRRARERFNEAVAPRGGPATLPDIVADLVLDDRLDEAEAHLQGRKTDLESAKARRDTFEKFTVAKATKQLAIDVERTKSDEVAKQSAMEGARAHARWLERQIEGSTFRAPVDGYFIHANDPGRRGGQPVQIEVGATVRDRQILGRVIEADDPMRVNVKVHESMVDQLKPGMPVRIEVDAYPGEELTGVVRSIAPMADPLRPGADPAVKVYTTYVAITKGRPDLRPGMSARVEILIAERLDALRVPIASLVFLDDKPHVGIKSPAGAVEWREVTLGIANEVECEIKAGLKPGDLVVRDPRARMGPDWQPKPRARPRPSP